MKKYLIGRLREPSTWASIGLLAAAFGVPVAVLPIIAKVGAAVTAVMGVVLPEGQQ